MPRKRCFVEITAFLVLAGCASSIATLPEVGKGGTIRLVEPRAQAWSSLEGCVGDPAGAAGVCVSVKGWPATDEARFQPARLGEVAVNLGLEKRVVRWDGDDVARIDDPILHLMLVKPSWEAGKRPEANDFVEVWLPFGFIRNRAACAGVDDVKALSDMAVFTAGFDGRREMTVEQPECLQDE